MRDNDSIILNIFEARSCYIESSQSLLFSIEHRVIWEIRSHYVIDKLSVHSKLFEI